MRVYLDACSLQRPLDDRSQPRINVEAEAVLAVLRLVEAGRLELLSSEALLFELGRIADPERQRRADEMLKLAKQVIEVTEEIKVRAEAFLNVGIKPMDALHLASASGGNADFFCSCDDKFLKKSKGLTGLATMVVSPLELIAEVAP